MAGKCVVGSSVMGVRKVWAQVAKGVRKGGREGLGGRGLGEDELGEVGIGKVWSDEVR